ncbi:UDP-glucosyltransferase 2-like [Drosophila ficusphila]|uniref:UDP-glucosyltransferase 2-like n=1 Tax=Drosophila ficusphila TaxID=30025 RepID=UPI0007E6B572|nr:UDP-glucosyltransferase 2-like [Drosophila ficusphila]
MRFSYARPVLGVCLLLLVNFNFEQVETANILGIFPYQYTSPFLVVKPFVQSLVQRGHNVTLITPKSMPEVNGVRYLRVTNLNKRIQKLLESDELFDFIINKWRESILATKMYFHMCQDILSDDAVQRMLKDRNEHFDLIMMEATNLDALCGLVEYYNATLVGLSFLNFNWYTEERAGNHAPSIYQPISHIGYSRDYSLLSRIFNWIHITEEMLMESLIILPSQLQLFKKFFGYSEQKFYELRNKYSVILVNDHFSMGNVRANVPNIIEVGGLHLSEPPEPSDESLQRFMDEAEHGVIYFSMGLDILVQFLPDNMQQPMMQAFSQLKQRVVWKNELFNMPNKSENVYAIEKAPQRHILEHPNIRLFITNGGSLSVMEAVYSGVPMLGLPVFFDQFGNLRFAELAGMAEVLDINTLNADILTNTIRELIKNPKYTLRAKEMSNTFRDRPMSPLDAAVWWTEYALRNRNPAHMRLNKEEISLMRYYRLDWMLPFGLRFIIVFGSVLYLIWKVIQKKREWKKTKELKMLQPTSQ